MRGLRSGGFDVAAGQSCVPKTYPRFGSECALIVGHSVTRRSISISVHEMLRPAKTGNPGRMRQAGSILYPSISPFPPPSSNDEECSRTEAGTVGEAGPLCMGGRRHTRAPAICCKLAGGPSLAGPGAAEVVGCRLHVYKEPTWQVAQPGPARHKLHAECLEGPFALSCSFGCHLLSVLSRLSPPCPLSPNGHRRDCIWSTW